MSPVTMVVIALLVACIGALLATVRSVRQQQERADEQSAQLVAALRDELVAQQQTATELAADRHQRDLQHAIAVLTDAAGERLDARTRAGAAELDGKKTLIDDELQRLSTTLQQVTTLVRQLDTERSEQLGQVREQLAGVTRTHAQLADTTGALREALTSSQARGQWGERMAADVLTAAGFKEGVNYVTQQTLPSGSRPDVTFWLPGEQCLHMDVKFPLSNYLAMVQATADQDREHARKAFLRDVRARVKELPARGYVDPEGGTLDCVLLFLPNDHVYGYVHEQDPELLDAALSDGVVLCSPSTLFAVLAVIRRSCDSVALQRTSDRIVELLAGFSAQWGRYVGEVERLGKQLDTVRRTYDGLATTRRNQLERQLAEVDRVREDRGLAPTLVGEDGPGRVLRLSPGPQKEPEEVSAVSSETGDSRLAPRARGDALRTRSVAAAPSDDDGLRAATSGW